MDKEKKYLSIVFVIGLIGVSNLAGGILSSLYLSDMNLPERISAINSTIGSFDPKLVKTLDLQTSVSIIQDSVMEELTNLMKLQSNAERVTRVPHDKWNFIHTSSCSIIFSDIG